MRKFIKKYINMDKKTYAILNKYVNKLRCIDNLNRLKILSFIMSFEER